MILQGIDVLDNPEGRVGRAGRRPWCLGAGILLFLAAAGVGQTLCHGTPATVPKFQHVITVVEENQSYEDIADNPLMPYFNRLASRGVLARQYYANTHPSMNNYFYLTAGKRGTTLPGPLADTFSGTVSGETVASLLTRQGVSWKSYAEGLPEPGYVGGNRGLYVKRHNPFAYFQSVLADPKERQKLVPFPEFAADWASHRLPAYSFVVPNLIHDGHNNPRTRKRASCGDRESLQGADRWLEENIGPVVESEEFRRDGLLMVVFDEGCEHSREDNRRGPQQESGGGGRIAVVFFGAHLPAEGCVTDVVVHHESALRLALEALGVQSFPNGAAGAADLGGIFVQELVVH